MIQGSKCTDKQSLLDGTRVKGWVDIETVATRNLAMLNRATALGDSTIQPQNTLEALKKDRGGQQSACINDQWRLCFRWMPAGPENIEIVDHQ